MACEESCILAGALAWLALRIWLARRNIHIACLKTTARSKPSYMRTARVFHALTAALLVALCAAPARTAKAQAPMPTPVRQERGNLVLEGIPAPDPALAARLERYLHARQASFLDWL